MRVARKAENATPTGGIARLHKSMSRPHIFFADFPADPTLSGARENQDAPPKSTSLDRLHFYWVGRRRSWGTIRNDERA